MKFNIDRISQLAGIKSTRNRRSLNESYSALDEMEEMDHDLDEMEEMDHDLDEMEEDSLYEKKKKDDEDDADENEVVEINEADLVKELRRAKVLMRESRKRQQKRKQNLLESQLKAVIDQEVKNVLKELNLGSTSSWLYGKNKPKRSKKGYTHQGSFLKGIGFK